MELTNLQDNLYKRVVEANLFTNHFGTFTKQDYEILMFTAYLDSINGSVRDYDISIALGIPEAKVRNLRLKSQLLYPRKLVWADELAESISHGYYDKQTGMITVTFEDPSVQNMIKNMIESEFGSVGRSLNTKQLILPVESFLILAAYAEKDPDYVLSALNKELQKESKDIAAIEKKNLKARFLKPVPNAVCFISNALTVFAAGQEIIRALLNIMH